MQSFANFAKFYVGFILLAIKKKQGLKLTKSLKIKCMLMMEGNQANPRELCLDEVIHAPAVNQSINQSRTFPMPIPKIMFNNTNHRRAKKIGLTSHLNL